MSTTQQPSTPVPIKEDNTITHFVFGITALLAIAFFIVLYRKGYMSIFNFKNFDLVMFIKIACVLSTLVSFGLAGFWYSKTKGGTINLEEYKIYKTVGFVLAIPFILLGCFITMYVISQLPPDVVMAAGGYSRF